MGCPENNQRIEFGYIGGILSLSKDNTEERLARESVETIRRIPLSGKDIVRHSQ